MVITGERAYQPFCGRTKQMLARAEQQENEPSAAVEEAATNEEQSPEPTDAQERIKAAVTNLAAAILEECKAMIERRLKT